MHRLQILVDDLSGGNVTAFEREIGVSQSRIDKIIRRDSRINLDIVQKIRKRFPEVNSYWVETGEGSRYLSADKEFFALKDEGQDVGYVSEEYENSNNKFEIMDNGLIRMKVKLITQKASAGYPRGWGDPEWIEELPTHEVYVTEFKKGVYRAFEAVGDSMNDAVDGGEPTIKSIPHGSIATGRFLRSDLWAASKLNLSKYIRWVIVTWDDGIIMKEIISHDVEKGVIVCRSRNPNKDLYPDFELHLSQIMHLYNIVQVTFIDK